jgi:hypothetical protein
VGLHYGSGYLPSADYWRLGASFGNIFFHDIHGTVRGWVLARG